MTLCPRCTFTELSATKPTCSWCDYTLPPAKFPPPIVRRPDLVHCGTAAFDCLSGQRVTTTSSRVLDMAGEDIVAGAAVGVGSDGLIYAMPIGNASHTTHQKLNEAVGAALAKSGDRPVAGSRPTQGPTFGEWYPVSPAFPCSREGCDENRGWRMRVWTIPAGWTGHARDGGRHFVVEACNACTYHLPRQDVLQVEDFHGWPAKFGPFTVWSPTRLTCVGSGVPALQHKQFCLHAIWEDGGDNDTVVVGPRLSFLKDSVSIGTPYAPGPTLAIAVERYFDGGP